MDYLEILFDLFLIWFYNGFNHNQYHFAEGFLYASGIFFGIVVYA